MKLGIIGLDSSHAVQFSRILNGEREPFHIGGHPVTAAYPGPVSQDFDMSRDRMENFTREVAGDWGVKLYSSIAEVMKNSDAVFLEQVDARRRLEQFREMVCFGKPIYVDKPFALNTADCREMFKLAEQYGVPVLSTSSLRFADGLTAALKQCEWHSVISSAPCRLPLRSRGISGMGSTWRTCFTGPWGRDAARFPSSIPVSMISSLESGRMGESEISGETDVETATSGEPYSMNPAVCLSMYPRTREGIMSVWWNRLSGCSIPDRVPLRGRR